MTELFKKTWRGEVGLARTFWLSWVAPTIILFLLLSSDVYRLFLVKTIQLSIDLSLFVAYAIPVLFFGYQVFMAISTWRSSTKYDGRKVWPVTAKSVTVVYMVVLVGINGFLIYALKSVDTEDLGKDSSNIALLLESDPEYPLVGLWKTSCDDNFGLSVARAAEGHYSVSFCGPGGCFKPGTYRPNTSIHDDPNYEVVDNNTIKVKGADGFSVYHRCN